MPLDAPFSLFKQAFLARFVKPSDSAHARTEIALLKQGDLPVEAYSATFMSTHLRIIVGSPIDTSPLAGYFVADLNRKVANALTASTDIAAMHDLTMVIKDAVDMEAKLDLAARQVPAANAFYAWASGHGPQRSSGGQDANSVGPYPSRGGFGGRGTGSSNPQYSTYAAKPSSGSWQRVEQEPYQEP